MSICWVVEHVFQKANEMQQQHTDITNSLKNREPYVVGLEAAGNYDQDVAGAEINHPLQEEGQWNLKVPAVMKKAEEAPTSISVQTLPLTPDPPVDVKTCASIHQAEDASSSVATLDKSEEYLKPSLEAEPGEYRVLGKVKGMWEIMDDPVQRYIFAWP